ncbi:MAG: porin [Bacteroidetes bacterium]|nr:porin [Bacteroidota bacterium]
MNIKTLLTLSIVLLIIPAAYGQTDSSRNFHLSAYAEAYFSMDSKKSGFDRLPYYYYNHTTLSKPDINLAFVKAAYAMERWRTNLAVAAGSYAKENIGGYVDLFEANAGLKLSSKQNLWLDAGVFPSHIGFESAVSADCPTLSRSIMAENSPYYESGAKLTWNDERWLVSLLYLNGWQNFKEWQTPAVGLQLNYKINTTTVINYSNFITLGNYDDIQRNYHNLYMTYNPAKGLNLTAGFDIGIDRSRYVKDGTWWTPVLIARLPIGNTNSFALRCEYIHDPNSEVLRYMYSIGFPPDQVFAFSFNYDRKLFGKMWFRTEIKKLSGKDMLNDSNRWIFLSSLAVKLE